MKAVIIIALVIALIILSETLIIPMTREQRAGGAITDIALRGIMAAVGVMGMIGVAALPI